MNYLVPVAAIYNAAKILNTHGDTLGDCRDALRVIVSEAQDVTRFADAATQLVVNFDALEVHGIDNDGNPSMWSHFYDSPEALLAELPMLWQDYVVDYRECSPQGDVSERIE